MTRKICAVVTALVIAACIFTAGCNKADYADFYAFSSPVHAEVSGTLSDEIKTDLKDLMSALEAEFSLSGGTFTARFNALSAGESFAAEGHVKKVLDTAYSCYELTEGRFDPTVMPLTRLWQFYPDFPAADFAPPDKEDIAALLASGAIGLENVRYDPESGQVTKLNAGTELDFGGILKGYAAQLAGELLVENGFTGGYVNFGGSSLFILGSDRLYITHPRKDGNIICVDMKGKNNAAVSTSGDYERTYTYNGRSYCHIIDPETGMTAGTGVASVTLIGGDGAAADAITTALCLCSHSPESPSDPAASELVRLMQKVAAAYPGAVIFAVYDGEDAKQIITNAQAGGFTLEDDSYTPVYI